jgi:hypothetical protein
MQHAGLSFPLSFLWALRQLVETKAASAQEILRAPRLRVIAAGCSHRLEQRILQETNYFSELSHMLPASQISLCMIGPEMHYTFGAGEHDLKWTEETPSFRWTTSTHTLKTFVEVLA